VLGVNSNRLFWVRSLFKVKFKEYPAVKLYGTFGEQRKATEKEINRLARRMRLTKRLKGHKYLWDTIGTVREITFSKAEKINLGRMTEQL
jgi:hypothetical protein